MNRTISNLTDKVENWNITYSETRILKISGVTMYAFGMLAKKLNFVVVASGFSENQLESREKARYELLERIATLEASTETSLMIQASERDLFGNAISCCCLRKSLFPKSVKPSFYRYSLSNGVAIHKNWRLAAINSVQELVERHLILESWYQQRSPIIETGGNCLVSSIKKYYKPVFANFGSIKTNILSSELHSYGVFLFPFHSRHPFIYGFGGGSSSDSARIKAESETLQRLTFLLGTKTRSNIKSSSLSPEYNQEFFLIRKNQNQILRWLFGNNHKSNRNHYQKKLTVKLFDISSLEMKHLKLAKAISDEAIPLTFGKYHVNDPHPIS